MKIMKDEDDENKYIARAGRKTAGSLQDLRKAAWYLDREIKRREHQ